MRKKLESLQLSALKDIAKEKQVKHYSTMKKAELIDILAKLSELEEQDENVPEKEIEPPKAARTPKASEERTVYKRREIPDRREESSERTVRAQQVKRRPVQTGL